MKYFLWLLRIVVGVLFIFSGIVKANDPMGLVYKMDEFFQALDLTFMSHYSFAFSLFMIAFEIVCGVAVLLGFAFRFFSMMLVLLNFFFLFITAYALYTGKVKECGCFGACIKISSQATFNKDIILTILSLILFAYRNRITGLFNRHLNTAIMILASLFSIGIQWWNLEHLPYVDCMPYKPGNNIWNKMQPGPDYKPAVITSIFVYEKDGKKKEFTTDNYPWQDTTWKFVERKDKTITETIGEPEIHDFILLDTDKNDVTQQVLSAKGYAFFWFVREFNKADMTNIDKLRSLANKAAEQHIPFYALCSADRESAMDFLKKWNLTNVTLLSLDYTASKTAMRSNPGLMLINTGVVAQKWSYRDYPSDMTLNSGVPAFKK
jgi:uncharacterized membrane protein YphA (DoxX/SURF4 family)